MYCIVSNPGCSSIFKPMICYLTRQGLLVAQLLRCNSVVWLLSVQIKQGHNLTFHIDKPKVGGDLGGKNRKEIMRTEIENRTEIMRTGKTANLVMRANLIKSNNLTDIVQFQKISIPTQWKVSGNSEGGLKGQNLKRNVWGLSGNSRVVGGFNPKILPWEGYFWNNTLLHRLRIKGFSKNQQDKNTFYCTVHVQVIWHFLGNGWKPIRVISILITWLLQSARQWDIQAILVCLQNTSVSVHSTPVSLHGTLVSLNSMSVSLYCSLLAGLWLAFLFG